MRCQDLGVVQLEQLRRSLRTEERRWLRQRLQNKPEKEVRELAQAAGLQRIYKDSNNSWVAVGELRAALVEHLAPDQQQQALQAERLGIADAQLSTTRKRPASDLVIETPAKVRATKWTDA